jgi:hypothetical protein
MIALAVTAWIAIHRYRLFDARLVVSRGLAYGTLTACVVATLHAGLVVACIFRLPSASITNATSGFEWVAIRLTMLGCDFEVRQPPALVE